MKKPEAILQMRIVEILSLNCRRYNFAFHAIINEALLFGAAEKRKEMFAKMNYLKKMGMIPGTADLIITKKGQTHYLEFKRSNGVMSDNQINFKTWVLNAGAKHAVVTNLEQFNFQMTIWEIFK